MAQYQIRPFANERTSQDTIELQAQILEYRTAGMTFPQIAKILGYSERYIFKQYEKALAAIIAPEVIELRKQEGERLDVMLVPCMAKIMAARDAAMTGQPYETPINEMMLSLRIAERRARLFGIDMPTDVPKGMGRESDPLAFLQALNIATMDSGELERLRDILRNAHEAQNPPDPE
jgi:hypothetical protein